MPSISSSSRSHRPPLRWIEGWTPLFSTVRSWKLQRQDHRCHRQYRNRDRHMNLALPPQGLSHECTTRYPQILIGSYHYWSHYCGPWCGMALVCFRASFDHVTYYFVNNVRVSHVTLVPIHEPSPSPTIPTKIPPSPTILMKIPSPTPLMSLQRLTSIKIYLK